MRVACARFVRAAIAFAILLSPQLSLACPVCGTAADEQSKTAFIVSTAFMTLFPLMMIGLVAWWFVRRIREVEKARDAQLPARPETASAYR
jgi:hypothetical protein